jgi:uncharacterized protein YlxW (UPF0749 family)
MSVNFPEILIPIVLFLFIIWLTYRIENRLARRAIYRNFPFFKDAVGNFQQKIDNLNARIESLEKKLTRLEREIREPRV